MTPGAERPQQRPASRLLRFLPAGSFARSATLLAGGTAAGQAIIVLASPLLTRLYTPEEFGLLAVYAGALLILAGVASLRYELAILLPEDDNSASQVLLLSLSVVLALALLLTGLTWSLGHTLTGWLRIPQARGLLWLLPLGFVAVGSYQVFNHWALRKTDFAGIARTRIAYGATTVLTQIGLFSLGPLGLIAGHILGHLAAAWTMIRRVLRRDGNPLHAFDFAALRAAALRYRRFPLLSGWSAMLNSIGLQLPLLLIASFYGPQIAGWIALGQRVVGAPMSLIGNSIAQVYLSAASQARNERPGEIPLLLRATLRRQVVLGFPLIALIAFVAPIAFPWIFGAAWQESGSFVRLLAPMFFLQFVANAVGGTLDVLERQDLHLLREIVRTLLTVGPVLAAGLLQLSPTRAVLMLAAGGCAAYVIGIALSLHAARRSRLVRAQAS